MVLRHLVLLSSVILISCIGGCSGESGSGNSDTGGDFNGGDLGSGFDSPAGDSTHTDASPLSVLPSETGGGL